MNNNDLESASSVEYKNFSDDNENLILDNPINKKIEKIRGKITPNDIFQKSEIKIYDANKVILVQDFSYENGNFTFELTEPQHENLILEVKLYIGESKTQCVKLISQIHNQYLGQILNVDFRTTLVFYLQQNENYSREEAILRVNKYFGLDGNIDAEDIVSRSYLNQSHFIKKLSLDAESQKITLDQRLLQLVNELVLNPNLGYKKTSSLSNPVAGIAMGLLTSAIYDLGKFGAGSLLAKIGLMDDPSADHQEIMKELGEISTTLSRVDENVKETLLRVKQIQKQLQEMIKKLDDIKKKQDIQLLLTQTVELSTYVTRVVTIYTDLENVIYLPPHQMVNERIRLKKIIEDLRQDRKQIANALLEAPGKPSMVTALVDSLYPEEKTHWTVPQFLNKHVLDQFIDFVTYYDDINILAYYMLITHYNDDDNSKGIPTKACDLETQLDQETSTQCFLYRELLSDRNKYKLLIPQKNLPIDNMFIYLGTGDYLKSDLAGIVYPVGNMTYKDVKYFYAEISKDTKKIIDNIMKAGFQSLAKEIQSEIENMIDWNKWVNFTRGGTWYRLITDPRIQGQTLLASAIIHGADPSAFQVNESEYRGWVSNGSSEWMADRMDVDKSEELKDETEAKYLVLGKFKNFEMLQVYLGQAFTKRFH